MLPSNLTGDLGCRFRGIPHDMMFVADTKAMKIERCRICGKIMKWRKSAKGRVNNIEYLKAHLRNTCQRFGATKRVYHKIYRNKDCKITL